MRFEEALTSLREGYIIKRKDWTAITLGWLGMPHMTAFWQGGFTERYRPSLDDIEAEDWLLVGQKTTQPKPLHTAIHDACTKLGM